MAKLNYPRRYPRRYPHRFKKPYRWPRENLYKAFVGMLFSEGWTVERIDDARMRSSPDHDIVADRFHDFMVEAQRRGFR